jgi:hypothetical protein
MNERLGDPRAGLYKLSKRKIPILLRESNPDHPARSQLNVKMLSVYSNCKIQYPVSFFLSVTCVIQHIVTYILKRELYIRVEKNISSTYQLILNEPYILCS